MGQGVAGDQGGDEQGRQCMNQAGGWGVGASQAGEHLKGLQRAAGKHWALLRAPLSHVTSGELTKQQRLKIISIITENFSE